MTPRCNAKARDRLQLSYLIHRFLPPDASRQTLQIDRLARLPNTRRTTWNQNLLGKRPGAVTETSITNDWAAVAHFPGEIPSFGDACASLRDARSQVA